MKTKKSSNITMKTVVFSNQKGGVGKSALACQLAYYLMDSFNKRVLFIDMDHQANSSRSINKSNLAICSKISASQLFINQTSYLDIENASFLIICSDNELKNIEKKSEQHNLFANNFYNFMTSVKDKFDICIIDTNPNPDIRMTISLIVSDFLLSPIQLNQEAIDGIGALKNDINKIKLTLNPKLQLIGILPNLVEPTPFQRDNLQQLIQYFANLMIYLGNGNYASIPKGTAIAEAQSAGVPVWSIKKTSARNIWNQIKPIFDKIIYLMGIK